MFSLILSLPSFPSFLPPDLLFFHCEEMVIDERDEEGAKLGLGKGDGIPRSQQFKVVEADARDGVNI